MLFYSIIIIVISITISYYYYAHLQVPKFLYVYIVFNKIKLLLKKIRKLFSSHKG